MSGDRDVSAALKWAKKENFPWPQVMAKNVTKGYSFMKHRNRFFPQYLLVDKDGNKVAEGLPKIMKKIDEL